MLEQSSEVKDHRPRHGPRAVVSDRTGWKRRPWSGGSLATHAGGASGETEQADRTGVVVGPAIDGQFADPDAHRDPAVHDLSFVEGSRESDEAGVADFEVGIVAVCGVVVVAEEYRREDVAAPPLKVTTLPCEIRSPASSFDAMRSVSTPGSPAIPRA